MEIDANTQPQPGSEAPAEGASSAPQITNLDSLSEFEFQGEKFTPERLQEVLNGYKSYQSTGSEDRYWNNLDVDLENVASDPSLIDRFKQVYPRKFHAIADRIVSQSGMRQQPQANGIPKEFLNEFGQLKKGYEGLRGQLESMSIEAANAKLDAILPKLNEKYPLMSEDGVLARAEGFISQGGKMTDVVWDRFAKESHEASRKRSDAFYKKELQTQVEKGNRSADIGPGGAAPGKAPVKPKTFEEAQKAMIQHLKSEGYS